MTIHSRPTVPAFRVVRPLSEVSVSTLLSEAARLETLAASLRSQVDVSLAYRGLSSTTESGVPCRMTLST